MERLLPYEYPFTIAFLKLAITSSKETGSIDVAISGLAVDTLMISCSVLVGIGTISDFFTINDLSDATGSLN